jgi:hypothetical protein
MKRTYILIALLAMVLGGLVTGCDNASKSGTPADTNAAPAAPAAPSTNK